MDLSWSRPETLPLHGRQVKKGIEKWTISELESRLFPSLLEGGRKEGKNEGTKGTKGWKVAPTIPLAPLLHSFLCGAFSPTGQMQPLNGRATLR